VGANLNGILPNHEHGVSSEDEVSIPGTVYDVEAGYTLRPPSIGVIFWQRIA
jgi:hypothetical protein